MADIAKLVEELSKLTVMEAAELAKALEEEWGVQDLSEDDLGKFLRSAYTDEIVPIPSRKELLAIASEDA